MEELEIIRGDDVSIDFTYKDADGVAIDITGYTLFLTAKPAIDTDTGDSAAVISKEVTSHSNSTGGESIFALTAAETTQTPAIYLADVQVKNTGGSIVSSALFNFVIKPDVTRRTTTS
jgi:hypothetical protein